MVMKFLAICLLACLVAGGVVSAQDAGAATPGNAAVTSQIALLRISTELWRARLDAAVARAEAAQLQLQVLDQTWSTLTPIFIRALGGDPSTHTLDRTTGALVPIPSEKETSRGPATP